MKKNRVTKSIFLTLAILMVSLAFLFVGYYLGANKVNVGGSYQLVSKQAGQPEELDFSYFWQLWDEIHNRYVEPGKIDDKELVRGAMEGLVGALNDPYSSFMPPSQSEIFDGDLEGSFGGVGIMIEMINGNLTVTSPLEGSPAQKEGIKSNDVITKIDDQSIGDFSFDEMVAKIRGEIGTKVKLTVYRPGKDKELEFNITRKKIVVASVEYKMVGNNIGYLRINQFGNDTVSLMNDASEYFDNNGADKLIVDLRNDPGGYFDVAIKVSSFFIDDGVIVYQQDRDDMVPYSAVGEAKLGNYSLVVLINEGSASAAEITAGALRDRLDAPLIGVNSFGKGSVQDLKKIDDWGSLRITSGHWLTPDKNQINGVGLKPDIKIKMDPKKVGEKDDKQFERAIKELMK